MLLISSKQYNVCLEKSSEFRLRNEDYVKQVPPFKSSRPIPHISDTLRLWSSWPSLERQERKASPRCKSRGCSRNGTAKVEVYVKNKKERATGQVDSAANSVATESGPTALCGRTKQKC